MESIPLSWYLFVSVALFSIGLYGVLARKNAVAILMSVELMLNAANINLVAFWRYLIPELAAGQDFSVTGQVFAIMVFVVAAAEVAVGLSN